MAKSNNSQLLILGAIGLAAVYLMTNKQQTSNPLPYYPPPSTVPVQTQQQQLLNWAQTQSAASTIMNIVKGLDWQGIADMWGKIFGGSSNGDYSGGGSDTPTNPYPEYDPYYSGEIWA